MPYQDGGQSEPPVFASKASQTEASQAAPSHAPGSIQPHGYLFVLDKVGRSIVAVSQNLADALGFTPNQLLGRPIDDILENPATAAAFDAEDPPMCVGVRDAAHLGQWHAQVHNLDGYRLLALEPRFDSPDIATRLYDAVLGTHRIRCSITTETTIRALVSEIKQLTGFDRVMVFRFDPDWQGEVIDEEKTSRLYSFYGHSFPAGDVPADARARYRRDTALMIPDVGYVPSPLVPPLLPGTGQPIDLAPTVLAGVSPAYLEYLGNMGVAASLCVPVTVDGEVWGLVNGQHAVPRLLPQPVLRACGMLTQVASARLADLIAAATADRLAAMRSLADLSGPARPPQGYGGLLAAFAPALLRVTGAQGVAIRDGRQLWTAGLAPDRQDVSALMDWLDANDGDFPGAKYGDGLVTNRLSTLFPAAAAFRDVASGVAARKLPAGWLVWFRAEWPHTRTWAGDPDTRKSFAAWPQAVRGESRPWSAADIAVVNEANTLIMTNVMADQLRRQMESEARTEARLRQLQTIANHLPALVLYRDRDGRFEFLNSTAEEWLGVDASSVRGKTVAQAGLPDDWLRPVGQSRKRGSATIRFPDGKTRTVDIAQIADTDGVGLLRGEVVVAIDMSEHKASELRQERSSKMDAIGTLTGGMAHDLNNLLGVVIGNIDLLKRLVKSDSMALELCDEALQGAHRGAELIRRLLAFARIQSLRPEAVDVNSLVAGSLHALGRSLGDNIVLKLTLDPKLWPTMVDPVQLGASLQNLAVNAREAMPAGGQLSIVTRNATLDGDNVAQHNDVAPGAYVLIEIGDTGTGMPPDVMGRIFEPFFTTKGMGKGIGLGLSVVFGFVKQSGGHLTVYSEPGLGTTFRLYLPRHGSDALPAQAPHAPDDVAGGHESVLVVEDNGPLRQAAERQLTDLGYRVRVAEDAGAALSILAEGSPIELLFTDVVMPGLMNGIELAWQAVRERPNLCVLLTSGFTGVLESGIRNDTGSFRLLSKPYQRDELARTVREVLDQGKRLEQPGMHAPSAIGEGP